MSIKKVPAFVLEYKFFDQLNCVNDIALYAFLSRLTKIDWTEEFVCESINLSKRSYKKSIKKLIEIGFLIKTK